MSTTPTSFKPIFSQDVVGKSPHYHTKTVHGTPTKVPCTEFGSYAATEYNAVINIFDSATQTQPTSWNSMKSNHNYSNTMFMLPDDIGDAIVGDDLTVIFDDDTGGSFDRRVSNGAKFHFDTEGNLSISIRGKHKIDSALLWDGYDEVDAVIKSLEEGHNDAGEDSEETKNISLEDAAKEKFLGNFIDLMRASRRGSGGNIGVIGDWDHDYNPVMYSGFANFAGNYIKHLRAKLSENQNEPHAHKRLQAKLDKFSSTLREHLGYKLSTEIIYNANNYPEDVARFSNPIAEQIESKRGEIDKISKGQDSIQSKISALDRILSSAATLRGLSSHIDKRTDREPYIEDYEIAYRNELEKLLSDSGEKEIEIPEDLEKYISDTQNNTIIKLDIAKLLQGLGAGKAIVSTRRNGDSSDPSQSKSNLEQQLAAITSIEINGQSIDVSDITSKMIKEIKAIEAKLKENHSDKHKAAKAIVRMFQNKIVEGKHKYKEWINSLGGNEVIIKAILDKLQ